MSETATVRSASRRSRSVHEVPSASRWSRSTRPGKYGHGLALAPQAEALAEALLHLRGRDALQVLLDLHRDGRTLDDIESEALEPALVKVGELWLRGRVDDYHFHTLGELAENVERQFRLAVATPTGGR